MRIRFTSYALVLLFIALAFSGPAWSMMTLSKTTLAELCVDGAVQVVRLGPDGEPTTPEDVCANNHACCILATVPSAARDVSLPQSLAPQRAAAPVKTDVMTSRAKFLIADPRGPPVVRDGRIDYTVIHS